MSTDSADNLYLDVHIIQSVPSSNLNRDDTGSPKTANYGGVTRARVSSQAWKRATRIHFAAQQSGGDRATRTKQIEKLLTDRLVEHAEFDAERAGEIVEALLIPLDITPGKKKGDTSYLLFFGYGQLDTIVDGVAAHRSDIEGLTGEKLKNALRGVDVKAALEKGHPLDVALFGRMVAELAGLNVDASVQVAHAVSTHAVRPEFDYYTAVDDENTREETGAGMIGTIEFNSATLYRYATVGLSQLVDNLGGDVAAAVRAADQFVDGFARSLPSGHRNSFAHNTRPALIVIVLRDDQPVSLVSAFEEPVRSEDGYLLESQSRLAREFKEEAQRWGDEPLVTLASYEVPRDEKIGDQLVDAFGKSLTVPELRTQLVAQLSDRIKAKSSSDE